MLLPEPIGLGQRAFVTERQFGGERCVIDLGEWDGQIDAGSDTAGQRQHQMLEIGSFLRIKQVVLQVFFERMPLDVQLASGLRRHAQAIAWAENQVLITQCARLRQLAAARIIQRNRIKGRLVELQDVVERVHAARHVIAERRQGACDPLRIADDLEHIGDLKSDPEKEGARRP